MTTPSTRDRILDTAESLFSEQGIASTSLRAITQEAEVNLAAVHYHFGSKADLAREVMLRRLAPLNRERVQALTRAVEHSPGDVEAIVESFAGPAIRLAVDHPEGRRFARLLARSLVDPHEDVRALVYDAFRDVAPAFFEALKDALPQLSPPQLAWRMHFMIGALAHTVTCCVSGDETPIPVAAEDADSVTHRLVQFLVAGLERKEE